MFRFRILLTLSLLPFLANSQAQNLGADFKFENVVITSWSDEDVSQILNADSAKPTDDGKAYENTNVWIEITQENGNLVRVTSERALYYHNGDKKNGDFSKEEIRSIQDQLAESNTVEKPGKKDFILYDPDGVTPVKINMGTDGEIICQNLYWSRSSEKYISGGTFIHRVTVDGDKMKITGSRFTADKNFEKVDYSTEEIIFE